MPKYVICMPQGGLNDSLCQIYLCLNYARKYDRVVLVLTSANPLISENLGLYFESLDKRIEFIDDLEPVLNQSKTKYPAIPDTFNIQSIYCDPADGQYKIKTTGTSLKFDFGTNYTEDILIHSQFGGGLKSAKLLENIRLTPHTKQRFRQYIGQLPLFNAIHIRNTDYKSEYKSELSKFASKNNGIAIFVATDSKEVRQFVSDGPLGLIHLDFDSNLVLSKNELVIFDLLLLALANDLKIVPLAAESVKFSGFGRLAKYIWATQCPQMMFRSLSNYSIGIADFGSKFLDFIVFILFYLPRLLFLRVSPRGMFKELKSIRETTN